MDYQSKVGGIKGNIPAQGYSPKDAGGKKVQDFISADTKISSGGAVIGTLHYVTGLASFGGKSGYFIPVQLSSEYEGQEITVNGVNGPHTAEDTEWLCEVQNTGTTITFATNKDKVFLTLTFAGATLGPPVGQEAIKAFGSKTSFGEFGNYADFVDGSLTVAWDGITGKVSGKLKWAAENSKHGAGAFIPIATSDYYADKNIVVYCKNERAEEQSQDWIIRLEDNSTPVTMKHKGEVVMKLDLSGLTVPAGPEPVRSSGRKVVKK